MRLDEARRTQPAVSARHRARWLLPAFVVLAWLAVGTLFGGLPGELSSVQTNDGISFLPVSAESTEVAHLQQRIAGGTTEPAVIIFSRPTGLTRTDLTAITAKARDTAHATGPTRSTDGQAAQLVVPIDGTDGFQVGRTVDRLRADIRTGLPPGLQVNVTGVAGYTADLGAVLGGLDDRLLLVTAAIVVLILVIVYRSPLLPVIVLVSAGLALITAAAAIRPLVAHHVVTLSGQSQGILFILVFGASTDYALLLVARCREELAAGKDRFRATTSALRSAFESIAASASTVILGLLCLLLSELSSNRGLGPIAAVGILASVLTSLTFLPAVLALLGAAAFWPFRPRSGTRHGPWTPIANLVGRRTTAVWLVTTLALVGLAAFAPQLRADGVTQSAVFLDRTDAVVGQQEVQRHFPIEAADPVVVTARRQYAPQVVGVIAATRGVLGLQVDQRTVDGMVEIDVATNAPDFVPRLRAALHELPATGAQVGGQAAIQQDIQQAADHDRVVIIPAVLLVVALVLVVLLRAVVLPVLLIGTVVLSYFATLGVGALVFNDILRFPGSDPSIPLYAFVFLVALGIDYNIFLLTRVREEARQVGMRQGTLDALRVTGGVISSAGVVLAATFSALVVLPILFMAQIAFLVAFGVLLDTLVVRSLLVPALSVALATRAGRPR